MFYEVIYSDCPWRYSFPRTQKNGGCTYPTMSTKELCELPIGKIAAQNSVLFQWATGPKLTDALKVMEAWGFPCKTFAFNWVKTNKRNGDFYSGLGSYTCSNAELCLVGRRGKGLKRINKTVKQTVVAPIGRHSAKPLTVRRRIELLYGNVPRIELFARECSIGWTCLGNEIDGKDIRDALTEIIQKIEQRPNLMEMRRGTKIA